MVESLRSPSESIATLLTGCHTPAQNKKFKKRTVCFPPGVGLCGSWKPSQVSSLFLLASVERGTIHGLKQTSFLRPSASGHPRGPEGQTLPILPGARSPYPRAAIPSQMPTHWLWTTGQKFKRPQLCRPEVQNQGVTGSLPPRGSE